MQQHQENPAEEQGIGYQATMEILLDLRARSEIKGALRARAEMLLRLLDRRGLAIDAATRTQVVTCEDSEQIDRWFDRAAVATRLDEVFT